MSTPPELFLATLGHEGAQGDFFKIREMLRKGQVKPLSMASASPCLILGTNYMFGILTVVIQQHVVWPVAAATLKWY